MAKTSKKWIEVQRRVLAEAAKRAADVVQEKSANPAQSAIRLVADGIGMSVIGAGDGICVRSVVAIDAGHKFREAVDAKRLAGATKALHGELIKFSFDDSFAVLKAGGSTLRLPLLGVELPALHASERVATDVSAAQLARALRSVMHAESLGTARPELAGVMFSLSDAGGVVWASDGHAFASTEFGVLGGTELLRVMVPDRLARSMIAMAESATNDASVDVFLSQDRRWLQFRIGDQFVEGVLAEGNIPDAAKLLATISKTKVTASVPSAGFCEALRCAQLAQSEAGTAALVFAAGSCLVSAQGKAEAESSVVADIVGQECSISASIDLLLSAVQSLGSERVDLLVAGSKDPIVLRKSGEDSLDVRIVMPVYKGDS